MRIKKLVRRIKKDATVALAQGKYEKTLKLVTCLASYYYRRNDIKCDDELEDIISSIHLFSGSDIISKNDKILFYDGFGLDSRGLAYIYISALVELGYRIIYIADRSRITHVPNITALINNSKGSIATIYGGYIDRAKRILDIAKRNNISKAFLYTNPTDCAGVLAFQNMAKGIVKYMIDLTDHTFWLGARCCNYYIEFREYGAYIAENERKIRKEKLVILPYYPQNGYKGEFKGFPFEKKDDDFIVFSGGALYKTYDKDGIYYSIVRTILESHSNIKFWYAGAGSSKGLNDLINDYPNRVYHTSEREDLLQILEKVDVYLSTYPLAGGLMSQYAARAGCFPLTLRMGANLTELDGVLEENVKCKLYSYTVDELLDEFEKIYSDNNYRDYLNHEIKKCIINKHAFEYNLNKIINEGTSSYLLAGKKYNTDELLGFYSQKKDYNTFMESVVTKRNRIMFRYIPIHYIYYCFVKMFRMVFKKTNR